MFVLLVETWSALVSLSWDSTTLGTASVLTDLLGDLLGREDLNLKADSSNVAAIRASAETVGKRDNRIWHCTMFGLLAKIICTSCGGKNWAVWRLSARYKKNLKSSKQ